MPVLPQSVRRLATKALALAEKEQEALQELHEDSRATVRRMAEQDPGLQPLLDKAYGYAVFPSVGKASVVLGGAFGKGEVFQRGHLVGYAGLVQLTLGVQLGGQTFSEIIAFKDRPALERFKTGRTAFAANASAVLVKAGAAASAKFASGVTVFIASEGGMMLEAAVGAQKFVFKPAALGRTKTAPAPARTGTGAARKPTVRPTRRPKKASPTQSPRTKRKSAAAQGTAGQSRSHAAARKRSGAGRKGK